MRLHAFTWSLLLCLLAGRAAHSTVEVRHADLENQQQLTEFLDNAHAAIEGEDPGAPALTRFLDKLNFRRQAINRVRFYNLNRETSPTHASNLVFMLGASHSAETLSGPAYLVWGTINGVPWQTLWPTAVPLFSLALPGIDWVCIALIGTYAASPDFRDIMTSARIYTVRAAGGISRTIGLSEILEALVRYETADDYLKRTLQTFRHSQFVQTQDGDHHQLTFRDEDGSPLATLLLRTHRDALALQSLTFHRRNPRTDPRRTRRHLRGLLEPFGWNIRDAVLTALDELTAENLDRTAASPFIASVESAGEDGSVTRRSKVIGQEEPDEGLRFLQRLTGPLRWLAGASEEHHVHARVERTTLAVADVTVRPGETAIHFLVPAIQLRAQRVWDRGAAAALTREKAARQLRAIRDAILSPGATTLATLDAGYRGALAIGGGFVWVVAHPREVSYALFRGGIVTPTLAGLKVLRIGTQVVTNFVKATTSVLDTAAWAFDSCLGWLVRQGSR